jgi:1-acyl-sn-glycerol-3-phosphate acyltransferase
VILIVLRSLIFQIVFFTFCTLWFIISIAAWFMPRGSMHLFAHGWARVVLWLHRIIIGARLEIRGRERIPEGSVLVASKHQSAWETIALLLPFKKSTYILKQELLDIPLFGRHLKCADQIAIDRGQKAQALAKMMVEARERLAEGAQIIIFPEGTRRPAGAVPNYKIGATRLYTRLNVPCVPVAMTSGLAWPRNSFLHYPRPILVEFLEPIPAGLPAAEFQQRMQEAIETNTDRLLEEAGFTPAEREAARKASIEKDAADNARKDSASAVPQPSGESASGESASDNQPKA